MPAAATKTARSLADYLDLFILLSEAGLETVVIGGCAVGAYAHLMGETVLSADLDLYATDQTLREVVELVRRQGVTIEKLPRVRSLPVAVFDWRGKEVNVLSSSAGLPGPDTAVRVAREFQFKSHPDLAILLGDPFDLLANKLAVNRPKDRPHIEILKRFIEEEVVYAFKTAQEPRQRIGPARRLLQVLRTRSLEEPLALRLVPLAQTAVDFRFLMDHVPTRSLAEALLARAPGADLAAELLAIRKGRRFPSVSRP